MSPVSARSALGPLCGLGLTALLSASPVAAAGPAQPAAQPAVDTASAVDPDVSPNAVKTTTPVKVVYSFNLAAGETTKPLKIPASAVPIQLMGTATTPHDRGVGQVVIMRAKDEFLEWTGLESIQNSAITSGYDYHLGAHILWLDYNHLVEVRVHDANTVEVHNGTTSDAVGTVTLLY